MEKRSGRQSRKFQLRTISLTVQLCSNTIHPHKIQGPEEGRPDLGFRIVCDGHLKEPDKRRGSCTDIRGSFSRLDLTDGHIEEESYTADYAEMFLGGNGFAAKMICDSVPADADPFGPENAVVFTVGPLTDTPVWGSSRGHMASISPLTGFFCDSNYGGQFAVAQKRTGYDAILVKGFSSEPVYLSVTDQGAEIRSAASLWGRTTEETIERSAGSSRGGCDLRRHRTCRGEPGAFRQRDLRWKKNRHCRKRRAGRGDGGEESQSRVGQGIKAHARC